MRGGRRTEGLQLYVNVERAKSNRKSWVLLPSKEVHSIAHLCIRSTAEASVRYIPW